MKHKVAISAGVFIAAVCLNSVAQPLGVRIEARCPDKTVEFMLSQKIASAVSKITTHSLVQDNTAVVHIRFIAAPVRQQGEAIKAPLGVALAVLGMRKGDSGAWNVIRFSNSFVPLDKMDTVIDEAVAEMLK